MIRSISILLCSAGIAAALLAGCQVSGQEVTVPPTEPTQIETETQLQTGWQTQDGRSCYILPDGSVATGWLELDGETWYLDNRGAPVSGICEIDEKKYLFDETGRLNHGWAEIDGKRCYSAADGQLQTGWLELEEDRCYFDEDGFLVTGWLELDGYTYYFKEDGAAARGIQDIDGEKFFFAAGGQKIILVNPWNFVPEDYSVELTSIGNGHQVAVDAYEDFKEMMADCKAAGHAPKVRSSYRTHETQDFLYERRIRRFEKQGYSRKKATELAGTIVAVPGTSEHQLGLALDIVDQKNQLLDESQAETATQQWLMENSWRYGWILRYPDGTSESTGIIYEPWHYRYMGREIAEDIHNSGLCLEDYLEAITE